jgi:hypothetical protein
LLTVTQHQESSLFKGSHGEFLADYHQYCYVSARALAQKAFGTFKRRSGSYCDTLKNLVRLGGARCKLVELELDNLIVFELRFCCGKSFNSIYYVVRPQVSLVKKNDN